MNGPLVKRFLRLCLAVALILLPAVAVAWEQFVSAVSVNVVTAQTPQIAFSQGTYTQAENISPATIRVRIAPLLTGTEVATVSYRTEFGTATGGSPGCTTCDYVSVSGVLTFTASVSEQTFSITIINDGLAEPDETVGLVLQSVTGPATLGTPSTATLIIVNDDATSTPTATPTRASSVTPIFVDLYEPNNSLAEAYTTAADAPILCNITLWPTGDQDFFRFSAKAGSTYRVYTQDLSPGLDTVLWLYNTQGQEIASNDDVGGVGERRSEVRFTADVDGFYFARIINKDPSDPANKTYCFRVETVAPFTPTPSQTPIPGDECEFNSTFETACTIGDGETKSLTFVPTLGSERDTDVLRLLVKPGVTYTCETHNLSPVADTNIILFDHNQQPFNPWIGNDDRELGDRSSLVSYLSTYTGWLYIMIGPRITPPYEETPDHTYQVTCRSSVPTLTPSPTATVPVAPPPGGGVPPVAPTPTMLIFTPEPSITPIDLSFLTPSPSPTPPIIQFQPLPTATPFAGAEQVATINVTLYYDSNFNFMPELTEGIMGVAVALYDNATGGLIAFGYTNEAGMVRFDSIATSGAVRVVVPFLNYNQVVVGGSSNILLRIAPQPLPIGIP